MRDIKKFRYDSKLRILSLLAGMNRLQEKRNLPLPSVCMDYKTAIERADPRSFYPYCPRGGLFHPGLGSKKGNHGSV